MFCDLDKLCCPVTALVYLFALPSVVISIYFAIRAFMEKQCDNMTFSLYDINFLEKVCEISI